MRDLDMLNRKFELLRAKFDAAVGADAAVTGPLEATIKSLSKCVCMCICV